MDLLSGLDALATGPFAYAMDDGMAFPGWVPPLLTDAEAATGYAAGERVAVLAGEPVDPSCAAVLDRRNRRLAVRITEPAVQLAYAGDALVLDEARWPSEGRDLWARRRSADRLQIATRAPGAVIWTEEWLARPRDGAENGLAWPEFDGWADLVQPVRDSAAAWIGDGALELVDADGWMLEALEACGVLETWLELGGKYDAPRAFGLPAEVQAKLADPLGWQATGRKWRLADTIAAGGGEAVSVVSDAVFTAGAGASGEIVTTVERAGVAVTLDLPSAVARSGVRRGAGAGGYPRPSTGAQVAVTAIFEAGSAAHDAIVDAVRQGRLPTGWSTLGA